MRLGFLISCRKSERIDKQLYDEEKSLNLLINSKIDFYMAWSFRRRIKVAPGVHLNLSKSGV